jgi:simple sugar transport system permease protein
MLRTGKYDAWTVMVVVLGMGMALGAIMGAFIAYLKVQPFIATLAGMWFARGLCFFISDDAIPINNRLFRILGQTKILIPGLANPVTQQGDFISIMVVLEFVVILVAMYIAHYTRFGRTVYAIGGSENSSRLMGLPVSTTKLLVYTLNGFCSALAGITMAIYVSSGHGLYARGFELTVIASVVIGGTMLTGGAGYILGTVFGVLITGVIQTLIQFNGSLSSWWTNIVIGVLMLFFIGIQSLLASLNNRQLRRKKALGGEAGAIQPHTGLMKGWASLPQRARWMLLLGGAAFLVILASALAFFRTRQPEGALALNTQPPGSSTCTLQPLRKEQAASLANDGAVIVYERNGGPQCIDELFGVYPDGRIVGDNGMQKIEKQAAAADVEELLSAIDEKGWFSEEFYNTWHTPCGQCFTYHTIVSYQGSQKAVQAVDGGTDAPADYWQVVSLINGLIPRFEDAP